MLETPIQMIRTSGILLLREEIPEPGSTELLPSFATGISFLSIDVHLMLVDWPPLLITIDRSLLDSRALSKIYHH